MQKYIRIHPCVGGMTKFWCELQWSVDLGMGHIGFCACGSDFHRSDSVWM